jgi:hypothetical protein
MPPRYTTDQGVLIEPGAYVDQKVQQNNSGLSTTGIIMLVGEAEAGPAFSQESDLSQNFFGPGQLSAVLAKYKNGPVVDAFRAAVNPANDPNITGAPAGVYVIKTNAGTKASRPVLASDNSTYGTLTDKSYGSLGNLTYFSVSTTQVEVTPTTGPFEYTPPSAEVRIVVTINGVRSSETVLASSATKATFVSAMTTAGLTVTQDGDGNVTLSVPTGNTVGAKSLEIAQTAGSIASIAQNLDGSEVTWISTPSTPVVLASTSERRALMAIRRQADGISNDIEAGGDVVFVVGYKGTSATMSISATQLTTTVVGGAGQNLSLRLDNFRRLSDLATYINSQTGYTAAVSTSLYGQLSPTVLDRGTFGIATVQGIATGRVKRDAFDFFRRLSDGSELVQMPQRPTAGLPAVAAISYLSGGTKGGTSSADVVSAFGAAGSLRGNFVVPLFSQNAVDDIEAGLTDGDSTYSLSVINAALSSHVLEMSKLKRKRNRQGFASFRGSFAEAKLAAQNIANYRVAMTFQDVRAVSGDGSAIKQFQPWMGSVLAAGMQAAGFYRSLVFKGIQASGALVADGSFTDQDDALREQAIENGLLAIQRPETGGLRWNSDQTTYATDESFVYNSVQAVYAADIIALTIAQRLERRFVGQSVADVKASIALSYLQQIMKDLKDLKLIAASDDAPLGYKNARITISGNVMKVEIEVKLAGAILFIPITTFYTQVQQSAAA